MKSRGSDERVIALEHVRRQRRMRLVNLGGRKGKQMSRFSSRSPEHAYPSETTTQTKSAKRQINFCKQPGASENRWDIYKFANQRRTKCINHVGASDASVANKLIIKCQHKKHRETERLSDLKQLLAKSGYAFYAKIATTTIVFVCTKNTDHFCWSCGIIVLSGGLFYCRMIWLIMFIWFCCFCCRVENSCASMELICRGLSVTFVMQHCEIASGSRRTLYYSLRLATWRKKKHVSAGSRGYQRSARAVILVAEGLPSERTAWRILARVLSEASCLGVGCFRRPIVSPHRGRLRCRDQPRVMTKPTGCFTLSDVATPDALSECNRSCDQ